jgi:multiple sugar transport system substrate-binding protein
VEIWQTFRTAYSQAVIFGKADVQSAFNQAAEKVKTLAAGS